MPDDNDDKNSDPVLSVVEGGASVVPDDGEASNVTKLDPTRFQVKLPSGATAQVLKKYKGKHIQLAARIAGPQPDTMTFCMARCAVRALVNSEPVTLEDILEMDGEDVDALVQAVMAGKAPST